VFIIGLGCFSDGFDLFVVIVIGFGLGGVMY
jgi:hypothetical protein